MVNKTLSLSTSFINENNISIVSCSCTVFILINKCMSVTSIYIDNSHLLARKKVIKSVNFNRFYNKMHSSPLVCQNDK